MDNRQVLSICWKRKEEGSIFEFFASFSVFQRSILSFHHRKKSKTFHQAMMVCVDVRTCRKVLVLPCCSTIYNISSNRNTKLYGRINAGQVEVESRRASSNKQRKISPGRRTKPWEQLLVVHKSQSFNHHSTIQPFNHSTNNLKIIPQKLTCFVLHYSSF